MGRVSGGAFDGLMDCGWISGRTYRWMADVCRSGSMEDGAKLIVAGWMSARMVDGRLNMAWVLIRVAGTKIVPSRLLPTDAVLPCLRQCFGLTKRETAPRGKNWQQCRAAGREGVSQPLDLDDAIFVR
jgi:hypothetical protein